MIELRLKLKSSKQAFKILLNNENQLQTFKSLLLDSKDIVCFGPIVFAKDEFCYYEIFSKSNKK